MRIRPRVEISAMKGEDKRKPGSTRKSPTASPVKAVCPCIRRAVPHDRRARHAAWAMNLSGWAHRGSPGTPG